MSFHSHESSAGHDYTIWDVHGTNHSRGLIIECCRATVISSLSCAVLDDDSGYDGGDDTYTPTYCVDSDRWCCSNYTHVLLQITGEPFELDNRYKVLDYLGR